MLWLGVNDTASTSEETDSSRNSLKVEGIASTSDESDPSCNSLYEVPEKFPDLSRFMSIPSGFEPKAVSGKLAYVDAGHIIYIKDSSATDTRINHRVMLVLFHNQPFSYTGLSFCCLSDFSGETLQSSHALVYTDQSQQPNTGLPHLKIHLRLNNTPCSLGPDIYLNLRGTWSIEQGVQFVILGQVDASSYEKLVPGIERAFCQTLRSADILKGSAGLSDNSRQDYSPPEKKNSKATEKGQVAKKAKKKKRTGIFS